MSQKYINKAKKHASRAMSTKAFVPKLVKAD